MRIIGGHNTDYQQVNAINGIMSPEFAEFAEFRPNSPSMGRRFQTFYEIINTKNAKIILRI